jgi:hypothetical protein
LFPFHQGKGLGVRLPTTLKTGRGNYTVENAALVDRSANSIVLTLKLVRADGIENVALRVKIATSILKSADDSAENLIERLAPWLEREFEQTREAALKTIRTEHRLLEIVFDAGNRGPF